MKNCFIFVAVVVCDIYADDVVLSKDSIWIRNSVKSNSKDDSVTLTNNGPNQVGLDSIGVHFIELDTIGFSLAISNNHFEALIGEIYHDKRSSYYDKIKPVGGNEYRILFATSSKQPFSINASGDSVTLCPLFGFCFVCSSLPRYPKYLKGSLRLYFSNGETDTLRFYSDDLRLTFVQQQGTFSIRRHTEINENNAHYLINGQKIPNKLEVANRKHIMHRLYEIKR
jgi:hypothetical protein